MRTYKYDSLLEFPYSKIGEITAIAEPFKIVAEGKVGRRISLFLENENIFAASDKYLMHRLRYVAGGLRGMLIPNFMPLWNRAMMDGFLVERIEQSGQVYEVIFAHNAREK